MNQQLTINGIKIALPDTIDIERVTDKYVSKNRSINQTLNVDIISQSTKKNYLLTYDIVENTEFAVIEQFFNTTQTVTSNIDNYSINSSFFISSNNYEQMGFAVRKFIVRLEQI